MACSTNAGVFRPATAHHRRQRGVQERELIRLASLAGALGEALRQRGVSDPTAGLTGEVAIAIFKVSFERWVYATEPSDLAQVIRDSLDQLRIVTAMGRVISPM